ncbi:MAG: glycosyltransferase family 1 protein [Friedmanniella sp.]|nr:glycosyltransferase family 1 protein [Friedmanniella sp.]
MSAAPRVVYASFATPRHSGGVHVQSQHVQLLRRAGRDARLWVPGPDRPPWIDDDVPVDHGPTLTIAADDLLVLPEVPVVPGLDPAPGARKVVFNQNHFYTYAAAPPGPDTPYPGWSPDPAVWTVSRESVAVLSTLLPDLPVTLVPNAVDGELFAPRPAARPGIAWFPRKRPREAALLRRLFAADARLVGVDQFELLNAPRSVVAERLGAATVFVSLGHSEGFGLTVAEALASGCLVVGYDGGGGHELFEAPGAWAVPEQRPLLLLEAVVEAVRRGPAYEGLGAANRDWVLAHYGFTRTDEALQGAVAAAYARPGSAATATHPEVWLDRLGPAFTAFA